jgi:predicted RNA-binding Zn ribbon-like protein
VQSGLSLHPVNLAFFDELIQPLLAGQKVNPEDFLNTAQAARTAAWTADRYIRSLEALIELTEPLPLPTEGTLWDKVRTRLERFDFKPDPVGLLVIDTVEPELHLHGRPFFITEGSSERVTGIIDEFLSTSGGAAAESLILEQLIHLSPELGKQVQPIEEPDPTTPASYRQELLESLKQIHSLAQAAGDGDCLQADRQGRPAIEVLLAELPWRALTLHSKVVPCWTASQVDGLESICRASDITPPDCLVPAWRLFGDACEQFPGLRESIDVELKGKQDIGAFVSPADIPSLLSFLAEHGARIIQAATRHGEGHACTLLLRKIKECAVYAEKHGMGYIEAIGLPVLLSRSGDQD